MTQQQIAWAKSHDWFSREQDGRLFVIDSGFTTDNAFFEHEIEFTGAFSDLRDWAGY